MAARDENENDNFRFLEIIFEFFPICRPKENGSSNRKNKNNRKQKRKQFFLIPTVFEDYRI